MRFSGNTFPLISGGVLVFTHTWVILLQPSKALSPIFVRVEGSHTFCKFLLWNTALPLLLIVTTLYVTLSTTKESGTSTFELVALVNMALFFTSFPSPFCKHIYVKVLSSDVTSSTKQPSTILSKSFQPVVPLYRLVVPSGTYRLAVVNTENSLPVIADGFFILLLI